MDIYGMNLRGKFWPQRLASILEDPWEDGDEGRLVYDESLQSVYFATDSEWVKVNSATNLFNVGQKLIFASSPLPTGWNIEDGHSDRVIMITSSTGQIGQQGGDWTITGVSTNGAHNHGGTTQTPDMVLGRGTSEIYTNAGSSTHIHTISTDGAHTHVFDGLWRPKNVQFILGVHEG